ncbi:MAG TPA: glycosyltransferase family 4 protein [Miltoncostaea sp.]|nr:glycosyltransferase family 4 protein [Miltoncostaea sp.]
MRIGVVAPPWIPVPAPGYGGIEAVVEGTTRELARRGHDVVMVAAPGSNVEGVRVVTPLERLPSQIGLAADEWAHLAPAIEILADRDVVIDHSGPLGATLLGRAGPPTLHWVHGPLGDAERAVYAAVCRTAPRLRLVAISRAQRQDGPGLPWAGVAYNGLDLEGLPLGAGRGGYLAFLGRMSPDKGVADAIGIARAAGMPLKIGAKCREPAELEYFAREVEPLLGDDVEWLGELDEPGKVALLADAAALVFPIRWSEPFGMVMIESMAVGTPVLATRFGSVPEVVRDGVTGVVRDRPEDLAREVGGVVALDRAACREHVRRHFSLARMADGHERLLTATAAAKEGRRRRQKFLHPDPPIGGLSRRTASR